MEINVHLEAFEGPLDLLLHLIDKNKINIYDIPISKITEQYMDYLKEMEKYNLEIASEFLVMAATLLNIKSKMLLPKTIEEGEEEEDPREELVQKLLEYKMVKTLSGELLEMKENSEDVYYRQPSIPSEVLQYEEPVDTKKLVSDVNLNMLQDIFLSVLRKKDTRKDPIRANFSDIPREEISIEDKMDEVKTYVSSHKKCSFKKILKNAESRMEVIVTFLSILELIKVGAITVLQKKTFDDICILNKE